MTDLKGFRSAEVFNGDVNNVYLISLSKMLYGCTPINNE